jgi:hypothetical protein
MNFRRINNTTGWIVCIISCLVYILTAEATGSFWDCGEFLSTAYKLEVAHSPGAPLFALIGRLFMMLGTPETAGRMANYMSALASGFTILFLFWSVTHFARKILVPDNKTFSTSNVIAIMGAGAVGALAYAFSDSFWFSAVEAEVYALSSFFTAFVLWAMLKWEERADEPHADRWIILIAYMMGLSIGVHLLNLLCIPALVMIYYYRKNAKPSIKGSVIAFVAGVIILGAVQVGVIQYIPIIGSKFDLLFVNSLGMPFNSGIFVFFALLVLAVVFGLKWAKKTGRYFVHMGILAFSFILIGYSSFFMTIIRSQADVPIDMGNPDNAVSLISYLQREQYGNTPVAIGPYFTARPVDVKTTGADYRKMNGKYEEVGQKREYEYASADMHIFPRIWDSNDPNHVNFYRSFLNLGPNDEPTSSDNLAFFFKHQMGYMYWRYFLWNYAGRQNDYQGQSLGDPKNGNWYTGISIIDNPRTGDMSKMPEGFRDNKATNKLFLLPLILGVLGLIYHINRQKRDALVVGLLFFFTGLAIVIYVNNVPYQPRERDYSYAGSTYAFAIWIGLGVLWIYDILRKKMGETPSAALASVACLVAVPGIMAAQEWDDHDRSHKTLARDTGINYLMSCAPNAILFTEGDNDTYPLWYAQEVEGIRRDVRVINLSLLGTDWYIDQLRYKTNEADAVPLIMQPNQYAGSRRDYVEYVDTKIIPQDKSVNLAEVIQFVTSDDKRNQLPTRTGDYMNYLPTKKFFVPVDKNAVLQANIVEPEDTMLIVPQMEFTLNKNSVLKNDLAVLNIVAANNWKRPIYFSTTIRPNNFQGMHEYLQLEGLAYRLVPVRTIGASENEPGKINVRKMFDNAMTKFKFGGAERGDVYFDETNRRSLTNLRSTYAKLANGLTARGQKADAIKALDYMQKNISDKSFAYDISMLFVAEAYWRAGDATKAASIARRLAKYHEDDINYISSLGETHKENMAGDANMDLRVIGQLGVWARQYNDSTLATELDTKMKVLMSKVPQSAMMMQGAQ